MKTPHYIRRISGIVLFFVISFCLLQTFICHAWPARVVHVADGDTITVEPLHGGDRVKIRLHGIDAPESRQSYGQAAKGFVTDSLLFREVEIEEKSRDKYRRTVAIVHLDGTTLQAMLLENGLAWVWTRYCKRCNDWIA